MLIPCNENHHNSLLFLLTHFMTKSRGFFGMSWILMSLCIYWSVAWYAPEISN